MFPPKVTVRIFDFYQMRGDFIYYNWMLLDMVFNLLTDMKMIIHKKNSTYLLKMIIHKKMFCPQVQIMYYAGYRVLPEAPLREDWVQVINAIFNRTRIMVIRMIIIMAIQNLTSYFVHNVNFLPYSHQQLWMECLLQSQCLSIPLSTLKPLPW